MGGRKRIPTVLHLLRGNPGKRALPKDEPVPEALPTDVPPELDDPVAIEEWNRTIVPAINIGIIGESERSMAIGHCDMFATWRSQVTEARKHPHIVAGRGGQPVGNPLRKEANKTYLLLIKTDSELGLSPASRSRVKSLKRGATTMSAIEKFQAAKKGQR
jgi:P27 family predicted phage terminase small subunit